MYKNSVSRTHYDVCCEFLWDFETGHEPIFMRWLQSIQYMCGQKQLAWYANLIMNVTSLCSERKWVLNENHLAELIKYAQTYSEHTIQSLKLDDNVNDNYEILLDFPTLIIVYLP